MNKKSEPQFPFPDQTLSELERTLMKPQDLNDLTPLPQSQKNEVERVPRSFAPPDHRGIHELIKEIEDLVHLTEDRLRIVRHRLEEFDTLQSSFYLGTKP